MKKISEPIVFFGNERIATGVTTSNPTLQKLINSGYHVAAVVAHDESTVSRNKRELEIADTARQYEVPLFLPRNPKEIEQQLVALGAEAGVLVAYGKIIPESIIRLFPKGILNIHPSLLPLHRGPTPIESVMLAGEQKTGVTIMQLVKAMDAGPIYAKKEMILSGGETKQELADRLLSMGSSLLLEVLPRILDGTLAPIPQKDSLATYDNLISKESGQIDWHKPAIQIEREIRAFAGWPQSKTAFDGLAVTVTKARVLDMQGAPGVRIVVDKTPVVFCGADALAIDGIKPAGKKEMPGRAFLAGYKTVFAGS